MVLSAKEELDYEEWYRSPRDWHQYGEMRCAASRYLATDLSQIHVHMLIFVKKIK